MENNQLINIEALVPDAHRSLLLEEVEEMYQVWINGGLRFDWQDTDDPLDHARVFGAEVFEDTPCGIIDWLCEYTGEREGGFSGRYLTFGEDVYQMVIDTVHEAFDEQFGDEWRDDDDLFATACETDGPLYDWLVERLKAREAIRSDASSPKAKWQKEGF